MACTVCGRQLVFSRNALEPLSAPEMALAVRALPAIVGRALADYTCPYCEASHCFAVDRRRVEWLGANLYQPQEMSSHCFECRRPLKRLPGGSGGLTEKIADTSALDADTGLKCSRCHSICCVECCRKATRGRGTEGGLICPRCSRRPVDQLYYP
jgi:hypothetical protein